MSFRDEVSRACDVIDEALSLERPSVKLAACLTLAAMTLEGAQGDRPLSEIQAKFIYDLKQAIAQLLATGKSPTGPVH